MDDRQGDDFVDCPLIFSCYGRVHLEAQNVLTTIAQGAARRREVIDYKSLLARVYRKVGVEIWRRLASGGDASAFCVSQSDLAIVDGGIVDGDLVCSR